MTNCQQIRKGQKGFTLIELSIVLVIIGLIVGGVLVGQDLIKAAEIRATVGQKEKFDAAVNTFRGKYNGFPGDLSTFANFPLVQTGRSAGSNGFSDGDGLIESGATTTFDFTGESKIFWRDLLDANMIAENITTDTAAAGGVTAPAGALPPGKIGKGNFWHISATGGLNYFALSGISALDNGSGAVTAGHALTPQDALQIDGKLDDSLPTTGTVNSIAVDVAMGAIAGGSASPDNAGTDDCYDTDTDVYATSVSTVANQLGCSLRMRASF